MIYTRIIRVPVVGLQEIRHKTAVSTIRSTAEKAASRAAIKGKAEDLKKKNAMKSSFVRGKILTLINPVKPLTQG